MQKQIVIIGAGPTGLGAGHQLKELGNNQFIICEQSPYVGGLAASFRDSAGFTWDIGGHVMFSHYAYFDQCFDRFMGTDFQLNHRDTYVRMFDTWVPYPLQNNIRHLPKEVICQCLIGLIEAQMQRDHKAATNFKQFIDAVFGDGIVQHFMEPYCFKVWAHAPELLNKVWIGERVAVIDIKKAIRQVVFGKDDTDWGPNNRFKFPLNGGTGEFYRRLAAPLKDHIHLNKTVTSIDLKRQQVAFNNGEIIAFDKLISAMPLDVLCKNVLNGQLPPDITTAVEGLCHSGGYMVGVGIKQPCPSAKSWMYFPEDNCPFYRVTYLSNYSPNMTPDNNSHYSLLCETSYSRFKAVDGEQIAQQTIDGLINAGLLQDSDRRDIVDTWVHHVPYSYPTPTINRDAILEKVIPFLEDFQVYSRGRFGLWKYEVSNTDHCFMQGVELINRWLLGEPELTVGLRYNSTPDGRNAASHERIR